MTSGRIAACLALAVLMLIRPEVALAWWHDDWDFRKQIRFDLSPNGADVSETLADVPVLIRLSAGNFAYFGDAKPDGSDLRFVAADDLTPLPFYIEKFDSVNQIALIWVRLPRLTAGSTAESVFMYYGNPDAVNASEAAGVFDPSMQLVYDFAEADGLFRDKTGFGNHPAASTAESAGASLIGGGAQFLVPEDSVVLPGAPGLVLSPVTGLTISMWVRQSSVAPGDAPVISLLDSDTGLTAATLGFRDGIPAATLAAETPIDLIAPSINIPAGQWTLLALSATDQGTALFVDGFEVARGAALGGDLAGEWRLGDPVGEFAGDVDQLVFRTGATNASILKLASRNEAPFGTVTSYGEDTQKEGSGGHPNYFATTVRNVEGGFERFIILILITMAVLSWVVMFLKSQLLTRIERQNTHFLREFSKLTGDPLALDRDVPELDAMEEESLLASSLEDEASYHPSTLFPLYHVGAAEVKKRLAMRSPSVGSKAAGFSAETIGAIGSSIDAALVRQRQKLNRLMVLLTIAISGGPFLGLLGTVVGVMITFAAIAASGDVNVNSIAPGVAAALVATVAGLGVAIPALFGYNWLGSRIKNIDANTQVFADEFINRIAEYYN